ncbi:toprim domain-containing protein [Xenorhabdus griffiniae]|uniref:toprim domain-containing protein n=1 Tax=Xenorhabdus griffiniae TaxID=351672 RepID=UPI003BB04356
MNLQQDYRHVTCSHGVHGFTDTHREAFRQYAIRQVHIAYDNDKAGGSIGGRAATGRTGRLAGGVPRRPRCQPL